MKKNPDFSDLSKEPAQYYGEVQMFIQLLNYPFLVNRPEDAQIIFVPSFLSFWACHCSSPNRTNLLQIFDQVIKIPQNDSQRILTLHVFPGNADGKRLYAKWYSPICKYCIYGIYQSRIDHKTFYDSEIVIPYYTGFLQYPPLIAQKYYQKRDYLIVCLMGIGKHRYRIKLFDVLDEFSKRHPEIKSNFTNLDKISPNQKTEMLYSLPYFYSNTIFTIVPIGHYPASKRFIDTILYGSIPILISPIYEYPFSDFINYSEFVIHIDLNCTEYIDKILECLLKKPEKIQKMQKAIKKAAKKLSYYSDVPQPGEALDILLQQIKYTYFDKKDKIISNIPRIIRDETNLMEFLNET